MVALQSGRFPHCLADLSQEPGTGVWAVTNARQLRRTARKRWLCFVAPCAAHRAIPSLLKALKQSQQVPSCFTGQVCVLFHLAIQCKHCRLEVGEGWEDEWRSPFSIALLARALLTHFLLATLGGVFTKLDLKPFGSCCICVQSVIVFSQFQVKTSVDFCHITCWFFQKSNGSSASSSVDYHQKNSIGFLYVQPF